MYMYLYMYIKLEVGISLTTIEHCFCICPGSERLCHHPVRVLQFGWSGEPCFRVRRQPGPHHGLHSPPSPQLAVLNDQPGSQEHLVLQQLPFRLPHAGNKITEY